MVVVVCGERTWLWRVVDDEGEVLDFLVQKRRDARAAKRLMGKLLKGQGFAQRSLSVHAATHNTFNLQRHLLSRPGYKTLRSNAFEVWAGACKAA